MARSSFVATLLFVCALAAGAQTSSLRLPASACKNGTATAATAAIAGATYDWSVDGGSIIAGAGTERITIRFSGAADARVAVTITSGGASSTSAGTIPLRD